MVSVKKCFSYVREYRIAQNFEEGEILTDTDFKNLTENILTDGHFHLPYICKHCIVLKQFDGLNFDGPAGKRQNVKISPVKILRYTVSSQGSFNCVVLMINKTWRH